MSRSSVDTGSRMSNSGRETHLEVFPVLLRSCRCSLFESDSNVNTYEHARISHTNLQGARNENALSTEPAYRCPAKASRDGQRTEVKEQEQEQEEEIEICEICCVAYQEGDELKMLPCGDCFHKRCADKWLQSKRVCPQCKVEVEISL
jgi:hypothetical protein